MNIEQLLTEHKKGVKAKKYTKKAVPLVGPEAQKKSQKKKVAPKTEIQRHKKLTAQKPAAKAEPMGEAKRPDRPPPKTDLKVGDDVVADTSKEDYPGGHKSRSGKVTRIGEKGVHIKTDDSDEPEWHPYKIVKKKNVTEDSDNDNIIIRLDGERVPGHLNDFDHARNKASKLISYQKGEIAEIYVNGKLKMRLKLNTPHQHFNDQDAVEESGPKGYDSEGNPLGGGYDEYDDRDKKIWTVVVNGKTWKTFDNERQAYKAADSIKRKYGKKVGVFSDILETAKLSAQEKFKRGLKRAGYDPDAGAKRIEDLLAKQKKEREERDKQEKDMKESGEYDTLALKGAANKTHNPTWMPSTKIDKLSTRTKKEREKDIKSQIKGRLERDYKKKDKDMKEAKQSEAPKPRNFVAKNAKTAGAGKHKDAKKAAKDVRGQKHKNKEIAEAEMGKIVDYKPGQTATLNTGPGMTTIVDLKKNPTSLTKDPATGKLKLVGPQAQGAPAQQSTQQSTIKAGDQVEIGKVESIQDIIRLSGLK